MRNYWILLYLLLVNFLGNSASELLVVEHSTLYFTKIYPLEIFFSESQQILYTFFYKLHYFNLWEKYPVWIPSPALKGFWWTEISVFGPFGQRGKYWKKGFGLILSNFGGCFFHVFSEKKCVFKCRTGYLDSGFYCSFTQNCIILNLSVQQCISSAHTRAEY